MPTNALAAYNLYAAGLNRNTLLEAPTGYVPGPNPFNPGGLLEQEYVPQPGDVPPTNALAAYNLYAAGLNRNALIGPVY